MVIKLEKTGWVLVAAGTLGFTIELLAQSLPSTRPAPANQGTSPSTPYTVQGQAISSGNTSSPYAAQGGTVQSPASPYLTGTATPAAAADSSGRPFTRLSEIKKVNAPATGSSVSNHAASPIDSALPEPPPMPALKGPATTPPPWNSGSTMPDRPASTAAAPAAPVNPVATPAPAPFAKPLTDSAPVPLRIPIEQLMHFRPRTSTGAPVVTAEDQARLTQIRVMLAWLADPVTFPCPLRAAASGSVLEVRGTVPDHRARAHALSVAERYRGRLTLIDALSVGPVAAYRRPVTDPQELYHAVLASLAPAAEKTIHGLRVYTHANGLVTVTGTVASYEEKLAVGLRLQAIRGCACVDNLIDVGAVPYEGKSYTLVSADGRYLVPDENAGRRVVVNGPRSQPEPVRPAPAPAAQVAKIIEPRPLALIPPPEPASPAMRRLQSVQIPLPPAAAATVSLMPSKNTPSPLAGMSTKDNILRTSQPAPGPLAQVPVTSLPPVVPNATPMDPRSPGTRGMLQPERKVTAPDAEPKTMVDALKIWRSAGGLTGHFQGLFRSDPKPIIVSTTVSVPAAHPVAVKPAADQAKAATKPPFQAPPLVAKPGAVSATAKTTLPATDPTVAEALGLAKKPATAPALVKVMTPSTQPQTYKAVTIKAPEVKAVQPAAPNRLNLEPARVTASMPANPTINTSATPAQAIPVVKPAAVVPTTAAATTPPRDLSVDPFCPTTNLEGVPSAAPKPTSIGMALPAADTGAVAKPAVPASAVAPGVSVVPPPSPYLPHPSAVAAANPTPPRWLSMPPSATPYGYSVSPSMPKPALAAPQVIPPPSAYGTQQLPNPAQVASVTPPAPAGPGTIRVPSAYMVRPLAGVTIAAPPSASAHFTCDKPPAPGRSLVTSGVVVMASADEPANVIPQVASAFLEGWVKQRVAAACGYDAKELEVVFKSTAHMAVDVKVSDPIAAKRVTGAILQMPELEPYRVALKVQVAP